MDSSFWIRPAGPRRTRGGAAAVLAGLLVASGVVGSTDTATAAPRACAELARVAETAGSTPAAVSAAARICGRRVEAVADRSERSQTFANPDGSFTRELSVVSRHVRQPDGSWVAVDTRLRPAGDGSLRPGATTVPVRFSGGGAEPLVTVTTAAGPWSLRWPSSLPAPAVEADTAVYREVRPGVDLRLRAVPDGFTYVLVVRTRDALSDPMVHRLPLTVTGPALRMGSTGGVEGVAGGRVVLASGAATMWDSTAPAAGGALSSPAGPGDAAKVAPVALSTTGPDLVLTPDRRVLADPTWRLPVYVDPQISAVRNAWAYANTDGHTQPVGDVARVGRNPECCGGTWRAFFQYDISAVAGKHILAAQFQTFLTHSWNCTDHPVSLWLTTGVSPGLNGGAVGWTPGPVEWLTRASGHATTGCNPSGMPMVFGITSKVQGWANAAAGQVTLGLLADNETSPQHWEKFSAAGTALIIQYNAVPGTPSVANLSAAGASQTVGCWTGSPASAPGLNVSGGATLSATLTDADSGDAILARFEWQDSTAGTAVVVVPDTPAFPSPHTFGVGIPSASLPAGHLIQWRVRGFDNVDHSGYSPWCLFTVDNSPPGPPTITAADAPPFPATPPAGTVLGAPMTIVFSPAAGDTDIVGYLYGAGTVETPPSVWVPARQTGTASATVVPMASGLAKTFLSVVAVDRAGNRSPVPVSAPDAPGTRQFRANPAPAGSPVRADATGDRRADVTAAIDTNGTAVLWRWAATTSGTALAAPVAVQGTNTGYATATTRTVSGDFDGDGVSDVALLRPTAGGVSVAVQRSGRNLLLGAEPQTVAGWDIANVKAVATNLDGDAGGRDDIAVYYNDGGGAYSIRVLLANGTAGAPSFATPSTWYTSQPNNGDWNLIKPVAGDLDGDGKGDVVHQYPSAPCQSTLWAQFSTGTGLGAVTPIFNSGAGMCADRTDLVAGDLDGDGRVDLASFQRLDNCVTSVRALYGNADRTLNVTAAALTWNSNLNAWCATASTERFAGDLNGDGRADLTTLLRWGSEVRVFTQLTPAGRTLGSPTPQWEGGLGVPGTRLEANVVQGVAVAVSSTTEDWGWSVRWVNEGTRGMPGWSSWSNTTVNHSEWVEFTLPAARPINRIDLYPRSDGIYTGDNFPTTFDLQRWTGTAWLTVASWTGLPPSTTADVRSFPFTSISTDRLRLVGNNLFLMQLAEVEAYQTGA